MIVLFIYRERFCCFKRLREKVAVHSHQFNKLKVSLVFNYRKWLVVVSIISVVAQTCTVEAKRQKQTLQGSLQVREQVRVAFARIPIMIKIAKCESGFRQYSGRGVPLKNADSSATGTFQLMYSLHYKTAKKLGFNINTTEGNIGYAKYLYRAKGTRPWRESKQCWGQTNKNKLF